MPNTIVKLVYKREYFDLSEMKPGAGQVTTITDDGIITEKEYVTGSRKVLSVRKAECSTAEYQSLCKQLIECIDDAAEELTIFHKYGRIQKMDRGLGNETVCIGGVIHSFLSKYL